MREADWALRELRISTPENVDFTYEVAGPGMRFAAWLIDSAVIIGLLIVIPLPFALLGAILEGLAQLFFITSSFVVWFGYFPILEGAWNGQTIGKRVLQLRTIDARGLRLSWGQSLLRNLLRLVDCLPFFYAVGGLTVLMNRRGLRLGDLVAGTVVVKARKPMSPAGLLPPAERYEPLLNDFELCERVRRVLKPQEKDLLGALMMRRDRLEESSRMELFDAAAAFFQERLQIPRPDFVSPERFVLNIGTIAHTQSQVAGHRSQVQHKHYP